jgi:hypothetical protein
MLDEETWSYDGYAEVTFDMATSRVHRWDNSFGELRVGMLPGPNITPDDFLAVGDHKDQVIRLHGTPNAISVERRLDLETWDCDEGTIEFSHTTGRVTDLDDYFGDLEVEDDNLGSGEPSPTPTWAPQETAHRYAWQNVGRPGPKEGIAESIGSMIGTGCALIVALIVALYLLVFLVVMVIAIVKSFAQILGY